MSDAEDTTEKPKRSHHREARTTGEWVREQSSQMLDLFVKREEDADKRDARVLYLVAGFGLLGWLGFLVIGGYQVKTVIDAKNGTVEFHANEGAETPP